MMQAYPNDRDTVEFVYRGCTVSVRYHIDSADHTPVQTYHMVLPDHTEQRVMSLKAVDEAIDFFVAFVNAKGLIVYNRNDWTGLLGVVRVCGKSFDLLGAAKGKDRWQFEDDPDETGLIWVRNVDDPTENYCGFKSLNRYFFTTIGCERSAESIPVAFARLMDNL